VAWYPNAKLLLMNSKVSDKLLIKKTDDILIVAPKTDLNDDERLTIAVEGQTQTRELYDESVRIVVKHFKEVIFLCFHLHWQAGIMKKRLLFSSRRNWQFVFAEFVNKRTDGSCLRRVKQRLVVG
jgi:hypothetical protein